MKLKFESDLAYQLAAIEAVCDLFSGQEINRSTFTVTRDALNGATLFDGDAGADVDGYGNRLTLTDGALLDNLHAVQERNGLKPSAALDRRALDYTVEMETGTGKTYVYLRTTLELKRRFGFTKFIIVVPSVAIKEGTYKSLEITREHFRNLYDGEPYEYFVYDSAKLGQVRNFATSATIQIMLVTVGAINKAEKNNIYKPSEKTGGEKPIDLIRNVRPVVIVDEPQSVDGGIDGKGKRALDGMDPLCTLRYSATHVHKHHKVYCLNAKSAYQQRLVKEIEVASATVRNAHNQPFVRFEQAVANTQTVRAKVTVHALAKGGKATDKVLTLDEEEDLEYWTERPVYRGVRIGRVTRRTVPPEMELMLPESRVWLKEGEAYGGIDEDAIARLMIRRTIQEHFEKELRLRPRGIKVLSLFFIPQVALYRRYDADGGRIDGPYAKVFEEEFTTLSRNPDYRTLFESVDFQHAVGEVHDGYFAMDKHGRFATEQYNRNGSLKDNASTQAQDQSAYELIMRDKERLLDLRTPLRFIFSHSALREGWDNPNVFQICALREMSTERARRQTIGRGLRLCVNQAGERVRDVDVNTLTVVARESYEVFARELQREIETDTGVKFGRIEPHMFSLVQGFGASPTGDDEVALGNIGYERSREIWDGLRQNGYVDAKGDAQEKLKRDLDAGRLELPSYSKEELRQIEAILKLHTRQLVVRDAAERRTVRLRPGVLENEDFRALWERVKHKTAYRLDFDDEALIERCIREIQGDAFRIPKPRLDWRKAGVHIDEGGVRATERGGGARTLGARSETIEEPELPLPDLLSVLMDRTQLTRRSLARIVTESGKLAGFRRNPQKYIELASELINRAKQASIVDGIKYTVIGDQAYYAQELFAATELKAYLDDAAADDSVGREVVVDASGKSPYGYVRYESGVERSFARELMHNERVRFFAKLPGWFKVPTPLGSYNPDWAVNALGPDGRERLYLVVETKSSLFEGERREAENLKIKCGKEHFGALAAAPTATGGTQLSMAMEGRVRYVSAVDWAGVEEVIAEG